MPAAVACRLCCEPLQQPVVDLGSTPLANAYLGPDDLGTAERTYPLRAYLCHACGLLQLEVVATPESIFGHYAYFSSFSRTLLAHSERFAEQVSARLNLPLGARVMEVASNDGYLLQYFRARGYEVLGIEPARNVATSAQRRGVPTVSKFFGLQTAEEVAQESGLPSLLVANNVMAHVPDLNDFVAGLRRLLSPGGTLTIEFHHALKLVELGQFDNIYHEHFQYFSLLSAQRALARHHLRVVDVEEVAMQGGSLRVYVRHEDEQVPVAPAVEAMLEVEEAAGLSKPAVFRALEARAASLRVALRALLEECRARGERVVGFGAAAKGNTLLNYCGIHAELVQYVVDSNPHKQGFYLPGSRIPIYAPERVFDTRPNYVLVLPWNISDEIVNQMSGVREWGGQFIVPAPDLRVLR